MIKYQQNHVQISISSYQRGTCKSTKISSVMKLKTSDVILLSKVTNFVAQLPSRVTRRGSRSCNFLSANHSPGATGGVQGLVPSPRPSNLSGCGLSPSVSLAERCQDWRELRRSDEVLEGS